MLTMNFFLRNVRNGFMLLIQKINTTSHDIQAIANTPSHGIHII